MKYFLLEGGQFALRQKMSKMSNGESIGAGYSASQAHPHAHVHRPKWAKLCTQGVKK